MHPLADRRIIADLPQLPNGARVIEINGCQVLFGLPIEEYHKPTDGNLWLSKTKLSALVDPQKGREWFYETYVKHPDWVEADEGDRDVGEAKESHYKVGRAIDALLFDGEASFKERFQSTPEFYPSQEKPNSKNPDPPIVPKPWHPLADFCKTWVREKAAEGIAIMTDKQMEWNYRAYNSTMRNARALAIFDDQNWLFQVSFRWIDKRTGLHLQSRIDGINFVTQEWMDAKTTRYWSPASYGREFIRRAYHLQGFLAEEGMRQVGIYPKGGKHLIIGKQEFPQVRVDSIPPQMMEAGEETFNTCTSIVRKGLDTGVWYEDQNEDTYLQVPSFVIDILAHKQGLGQREMYDFDPDEFN